MKKLLSGIEEVEENMDLSKNSLKAVDFFSK